MMSPPDDEKPVLLPTARYQCGQSALPAVGTVVLWRLRRALAHTHDTSVRITCLDRGSTVGGWGGQKPGSLNFKIIFSMDLAYTQFRLRSSGRSTENGQFVSLNLAT